MGANFPQKTLGPDQFSPAYLQLNTTFIIFKSFSRLVPSFLELEIRRESASTKYSLGSHSSECKRMVAY